MPSTITKLFDEAYIQWAGVVPWSVPVTSTNPGIYVVSLSEDPSQNYGAVGIAPIDCKLVRKWMNRVPTLTLDGNSNSSVTGLVKRLSSFWLPDESILYIGQTTSQNLSPSLSSYKIILYISIAYKQENTLRVLQLRCCVDFMNESDDCSSGAARSGVNFQMPVNRFLQSFRL